MKLMKETVWCCVLLSLMALAGMLVLGLFAAAFGTEHRAVIEGYSFETLLVIASIAWARARLNTESHQ